MMCSFLLRPVTIDMTPVELKEQLIQSGQKHYSDMLSQEPAPTDWHLDLFNRALKKGAPRLARDVSALARTLGDYLQISRLCWSAWSAPVCR